MRISFKHLSRLSASAALLATSLAGQQAWAQSLSLSGTVVDQDGEPVIGATVHVAGTNRVTSTNVDGKFSIKADKGEKLQISYVGYRRQNITVKNAGALNVVLVNDQNQLNEVVVTALGITRDAKSLSYARQSIDTEPLTEVRGSNLMDMLTGKAAGMQVISGGGPTSSTRIVLRGVNSLTGNNQPLIVVDGVPIINNMGEDGDLDFGNPANLINPDEIEDLEVLKGANASALYGSDAANGVILITTKKATKKKGLGVTYGFNLMLGYLYNYPAYQNWYGAGQSCAFERANQGRNFYGSQGTAGGYDPNLPYGIWNPNNAGQDQRSWGMPMLGFDVVGRNGQVRQYSSHPETTKAMYGTSHMYTNSLSIDKVFEGGTFRLSYTNIISDDVLKGVNDLERHTFNLHTTADIAKWWNVDVSTRYVYEEVENRAFRNSSDRNPVYLFANLSRDASIEELVPWKKPDGTAYNFKGFTNPFWSLNECDNSDNKHWFMGNVTFNFKPYKMVDVRLRAATDLQVSEGWSFTNLNTPFDTDGEYMRWKRDWRNTNYEALVMFHNGFWDNLLNVNASIGASAQSIHGSRMYSKASQLQFKDMRSLSNAKGLVSALEESEGKKKQAVYGALSLGFDGWAYIDATARNEWSSALPKNNNSYFYWSVGTGLVISDLLKLDQHIFPLVKVRGSYAKVGNDTGYDRLISGYYKAEDGSFLGIPYFTGESVLKTLGLRPEMTKSWELGAELRLFDNRFSFDFTYYNKATTDQIVEADAPLASGYQREIINAGKMTNKGVELSFSVTPIRTRDWTWEIRANWAKNNNMVVALAPGIDRFEIRGRDNIKSYAEVGKPYGVFYGNDYKRDSDGNIYVGRDGKAEYEPDKYLGSIQPDWIGGAGTTLRWRNLSLGAAIDFSHGGNFWSYTTFRGGIDGNTVNTLEGRLENQISRLVYGENDRERQGVLESQYTNVPGADPNKNPVIYPDWQRPKGVWVGNTVYSESLEYWGGKQSMTWVTPTDHWCHNGTSSASRYIYSASYIKLREISVGYSVPQEWLRKSFIRSAKVSVVGRNVAILYQNCPKGMDPQATSSTGNAQGFEEGFTLPQATWGFDIKVTF